MRRGSESWIHKYRRLIVIGAFLVLVLVLLVDRLGFPHRIVQGAMIAVLGVSLFLMQKYWVFRQPGPAPKGAPTTGGVS